LKTLDDWGNQPTNSKDCPFCGVIPDEHEYMIKIANLGISTWCLSRDQGYEGVCLVIFNSRHVETIDDLQTDEYQKYCEDLYVASICVKEVFAPDHMNYALLGNVVRHLHWHIIPRYRSEYRWGMPIWTTTRAEMQRSFLQPGEYKSICEELRKALVKIKYIVQEV